MLGLHEFHADGVFVIIAGQHFGDAFGAHARDIADIDQHLVIADVAAILEKGTEQAGHNLVDQTDIIGPADHAVGVERMRSALDGGKVEMDAFFKPDRGNALVHFDNFVRIAEFLQHIELPVDPAHRNGRIELIGPPADFGGDLGAQCQSLFQPLLADIAPRADHIGNDVDGQDFGFIKHGTRLAGARGKGQGAAARRGGGTSIDCRTALVALMIA